MAERSSELDAIENTPSGDISTDAESIGREIGAPVTYAATAVDRDPREEYFQANTDAANDAEQAIDRDRQDDDDTASGEVDASAAPEEIKAQIAQTRNEMSETINAIQDKLSIQNLTAQVKEEVSEQISGAYQSVKETLYDTAINKIGGFMGTAGKRFSDATGITGENAGEIGQSVVRTAKSNPIPFALIGLGIGLMIFNNRRKTTKRYYSNSYGSHVDDREFDRQDRERRRSTLTQARETVGEYANSAYETIGGAAGAVGGSVTGAASTALGGVKTAASSAYEGAGSLASRTGEQFSRIGTQTRQYAGKAQDFYEESFDANPLAVGAVALGLGAIVGLAIPSSDFESDLVGEQRERLFMQAKDAAYGVVEQVQEQVKSVAGDAIRTAQDKAAAANS